MSSSTTVRMTGRVKFYDARRRYGFIVSDDAQDVTFHCHEHNFRDRAAATRGVLVEFTPVKIHAAGKHDKATDIVAVG